MGTYNVAASDDKKQMNERLIIQNLNGFIGIGGALRCIIINNNTMMKVGSAATCGL